MRRNWCRLSGSNTRTVPPNHGERDKPISEMKGSLILLALPVSVSWYRPVRHEAEKPESEKGVTTIGLGLPETTNELPKDLDQPLPQNSILPAESKGECLSLLTTREHWGSGFMCAGTRCMWARGKFSGTLERSCRFVRRNPCALGVFRSTVRTAVRTGGGRIAAHRAIGEI